MIWYIVENPLASSYLSLYITVRSFAMLLLYDIESKEDSGSQKYYLNL